MIAPMKKITLLVLEHERAQSLKTLRKLGVVHVESKQVQSRNLTELKTLQNKVILARSILSETMDKKEKKNEGVLVGLASTEEKRIALVERVIALNEEKRSIAAEGAHITAIIREYSGFGDFDPADFAYLKENGVSIAIASSLEKQYAELFLPDTKENTGKKKNTKEKSELKTLRLAQDKNKCIFLIIAGDEGIPAKVDSSITILPLPEKRNSEYQKDLIALRERETAINAELKNLTRHTLELDAFKKILDKRIEFETVYAGMETAALQEAPDGQTGLALAWLIGYIPAKEMPALKASVAKNNWALLSDDPTEDDAVPTKLEGNAVTEMIHPLFDFLNTYPGYFETDISWVFLLFFGIFVGMIFGDAGYGAVILLATLYMAIKKKRAGKKLGASLRLFMYLAAMILVWGTLSCSWFGIDPQYLPDFMTKICVKGISPLVSDAEKNNNVMLISFTIGLAHLLIAHIIAIATGKKNLKIFADIGKMALLVGMYVVVLNVLSLPFFGMELPIRTWVFVCIGVGFALDFVFSNYEGSIKASIIASLKDIINKVLGVVNVFSDIMSYVRLWAVGLAGASIIATVNSIAGPMFGKAVLFAFGLLICVFGNGLNMVLNVLSVLVHGVRLNTMEFAGHLGLGLTGFKYKPFSETVG